MTNFCAHCGTSLTAGAATPAVRSAPGRTKTQVKTVVKRKPSAYNNKYSKALKSVSKTYKKKDGSWKKNGFRSAVKAAHKKAKRMR